MEDWLANKKRVCSSMRVFVHFLRLGVDLAGDFHYVSADEWKVRSSQGRQGREVDRYLGYTFTPTSPSGLICINHPSSITGASIREPRAALHTAENLADY